MIRTPDRRLRVFVSSTLDELAPERQAVRDAIERLHLAPVMFEMGARPHPPRELYRAYLEQSDVFVGIYWQSYGWIAADEDISGLEDEYRLVEHRPKLVYLKTPAPDIEERLSRLVDEIRDNDDVSYKRFSTPEELATLVAADLALLLAERFDLSTARSTAEAARPGVPPIPPTETVGRADEIAHLQALIRDGARLVTLTGPGGIGKTRLAIETARSLHDECRDGVYVVPLAAVSDPTLVVPTLAERLGVRVEGTRSDVAAVIEFLATRDVLVVLDNLEQVVEAGADLAEILERSPGLSVLATSRQALRVRAEREVPVSPLPLPPEHGSLESLAVAPAVRLFVDRATAVSPTFELSDANAPAVAALCRRLDGLPLAIELAAARTRLLPPGALLERLGNSLDVLAGAGGDVPERQRTVRATIDWSYRLLSENERSVFERLAVFVGGFTLPAAESVCAMDGEPPVLDTLASLVDKSLLVVDTTVGNDEPRLRMLSTVRSFAAERLAEDDEVHGALRRRHLEWFACLSDKAQPYLCGPRQRDWASVFDSERANLRAAIDSALDLGEPAVAVEMSYDLYVYFKIRDAEDEPRGWLERIVDMNAELDDVTEAKLRSLRAVGRISLGRYDGCREAFEATLELFRSRDMNFEAAVCLLQVADVYFIIDGDAGKACAALEESTRLFESVGHNWGVALAESVRGTILAVTGDLDAADRANERALENARAIDNEHLIAQGLQGHALVRVLRDDIDGALPILAEAADVVRAEGFQTVAAICLDTVAAVALARDDAVSVARAVSVAAATRARIGVSPRTAMHGIIESLEQVARQRLGEDRFEELTADAATRDPMETLDDVLATLARVDTSSGAVG